MLELIYSNLQFYKTVPSDLVSQSPGSRASMSHDTFAKQTGKKNYLYYPALKALNKEQERVQTLRIWSYLWSTVTWKLHLNRVLSNSFFETNDVHRKLDRLVFSSRT